MSFILSITAKVSDCGVYTIFDKDGNFIHEEDGYNPFYDNLDGGDYMSFDIDVETGQIIGWNSESCKQTIHKLIEENLDEE